MKTMQRIHKLEKIGVHMHVGLSSLPVPEMSYRAFVDVIAAILVNAGSATLSCTPKIYVSRMTEYCS